MNIFNRKSSILILSFLVILIVSLFAGIFLSRTIHEKHLFDFDQKRLGAFYLAEAGVDRALTELKNNYSGYTGTSPTTLGIGQYETVVTTLSATSKKILAYGYVPNKTQVAAQYTIEAITKKLTPPNFYDYAIYSANNIDFTGNSYDVTGKAIYGGTASNIGGISGGATHDLTVSPLAHFDFQILRNISIAQGNLYTATRLASGAAFPTNFWYQAPTNPSDPTTGIPNVVYVEGAMTLTGNDVVGGFFLVVGNILTNPAVVVDTTLKGDITVNGCIYTTGEFTAKGGGHVMNITGGIWAGEDANFNGNIKMTYGSDYMTSIKNLVDTNGASGALQLLSWRKL